MRTTWQAALWLGLLLTGCAERVPQHVGGTTMGTTWSVQWDGSSSVTEVYPKLSAELEQVNQALSTWRPDSELSRLNQSEENSWQPVSAELVDVIGAQLDLARSTDGRYDPTVGPLVALWGFGQGKTHGDFVPPDAERLQATLRRVGWQRVELDRVSQRLRKPAGVQLDVSSGGPGYAVDRLAAQLEALGIHDYLIELGGEVRARGRHPSGRDWRVAIEDPRGGEQLQQVIPLRNAALGASGDYRDFRLDDNGHPLSHFIDPRSGQLVRHAPAQVTVIADSCLHADATATALTVMGLEAGMAYAIRHDIAARFVVRDQDTLSAHASPAFDRWLAAGEDSLSEDGR